MKVLSKIEDRRINSVNLYVEATFGEYLGIAEKIKKNNDLQRKRVRTSKTVYSLLKNDLEKGCVIPPLVLAITEPVTLEGENSEEQGTYLKNYITNNYDNVLILDGLQRTLTLLDADSEMSNRSVDEYNAFLRNNIRLEIYLNINKFGILYRMLTLNTGQTPMSFRHQLEMLYNSMLNTEIEGVTLIQDTEGHADPNKKEFVFKCALDGFNSYMTRDELPIDRLDILDSIKSLEKMSEEDVETDLFRVFIESYMKIFNALIEITKNHTLTKEELEEAGVSESPFGKSVAKIFSTSQALTGYGAAIGRMKDRKVLDLNGVKDVANKIVEKYPLEDHDWLLDMLLKFDDIKSTSKKIGNAQRMYLQYFFRELLNVDSDSFLNLKEAVENGYRKYLSQVN